MIVHTSTETTTEQELYRMVNVLSEAMTLASSAAISGFLNTMTSSGESALKMTSVVKMKAARKKLIPLQMERIVEPVLSIFLSPYARYKPEKINWY
jgi:hypothetical protein